MSNKLIVLLAIGFIILCSWHLYRVGLEDGEQNYKHSRRMYFALKSAYHFGWYDGHNGKQEDWDGD